jgi:serine protease AprX
VQGNSTLRQNLPTGKNKVAVAHKFQEENKLRKLFRLLALCGLAITYTSTVAWAANAKLSPELQAAKTAEPVEVIVQYQVVPTEAHHARVRALGGKLNHKMDFIKGAHYTISKSALAALANDPDVAYITPNRSIKAMFDQITDGTVHSDWANSTGQTGAGIGVAIIDSGIVELPDFQTGAASRIVYQQSFVGGTPADQYGHGTHVAGILAGNGNGTVYIGTAPQANIINLRVLDINGHFRDPDSHHAQVAVQHSRDQPFSGPAGI